MDDADAARAESTRTMRRTYLDYDTAGFAQDFLTEFTQTDPDLSTDNETHGIQERQAQAPPFGSSETFLRSTARIGLFSA